jgi:putative intracellular protease/amidase
VVLLTGPKEALEREGAQVDIVSPQDREVKGWQHTEWGDTFRVARPLAQARADRYDALLLPGGVMNPDKAPRQRHRRRVREGLRRCEAAIFRRSNENMIEEFTEGKHSARLASAGSKHA